MKFADIILPIYSPKLYTYEIPNEIKDKITLGQRVIVEVRKKLYTGIIEKIHNIKPEFEIKPIKDVLDDEPFIEELHLKFWHWIANYYMCTIGEVYTAALPPSLRLESKQNIKLVNENIQGIILTKIEEEIVNLLKKKEKEISISSLSKKFGQKPTLQALKNLVVKRLIISSQEVINPYKPKLEKFIRLNPQINTQEKFEQVIKNLSRAKKQLEIILSYISLSKLNFTSKNIQEVKYQEILKKINSPSALKTLISKGIFEVYEKKVLRLEDKKISRTINPLTQEQKNALNQIKSLFKQKNVVLLYGITSSGKTEIYIHLIQEQIEQGKQVLYLLPEIAITSQILLRLQSVFGNQVGFYHSRLSDNERVEVWQRLNNWISDKKPYKVIIGVRSAIFLPFKNLGLIIIDEEHENTYKQYDPAPRYNARDAAIKLAQMFDAKVLLGTATPSIESYNNALKGKYGLVELTTRYTQVELPQIILANIREAKKKKKMHGIFHTITLENIKKSLELGKQVILFRNRRGFAPYLECQDCGWIPKCKNCDVSLTYHKDSEKLVCHYCGYTIDVAKRCKKCGSFRLQFISFGTERVEEDLKVFFPNAEIKRLDLDSTRKKFSHSNILELFEQKKIHILVGTQMVTKGLDFDNVNLVAILNADSLVNFPNFRSIERAFQLMVQVSGRAGRKDSRGLVIIQTSNPKHPIFNYVIENDYKGMYQWLIKERETFSYPPFTRIIKIIIKHKNSTLVDDFALMLATELRKFLAHRVLGPQYPPVKKIQNWYIKEIMIKLELSMRLSAIKQKIVEITNQLKQKDKFYKLHVYYDVDPL